MQNTLLLIKSLYIWKEDGGVKLVFIDDICEMQKQSKVQSLIN